MERISIFNYEAFYLDFLEGNINEEDVALLLDFLKKHPELEVEMDEFPVLQPENTSVDSSFANSLKQVDFELDAIHLNNCEAFVIASVEQQLSAEKQKELFQFAEKNKLVNDLIAEYDKIKLVPDSTIVYPKKSELKKSRKIVLWPYVAAAASIVLFFFVYQGSSSENGSASAQMTALNRNSERKQKEIEKQNSHSGQDYNEHQLLANGSEKEGISSKDNRKNQLKKEILNPNSIKIENNPNIEIAIKDKREVEIKTNEKSLENNITHQEVKTVNEVVKSKSNNDQSVFAYNEMKNPIKPITNRLSDFTKTEIDVRTAKATNEKRGGFYLKIGKLEIERPTRK